MKMQRPQIAVIEINEKGETVHLSNMTVGCLPEVARKRPKGVYQLVGHEIATIAGNRGEAKGIIKKLLGLNRKQKFPKGSEIVKVREV